MGPLAHEVAHIGIATGIFSLCVCQCVSRGRIFGLWNLFMVWKLRLFLDCWWSYDKWL